MLNNAQLDNEKMTLRYQLESLKDKLDDFEEARQELQREHRKLAQVSACLILLCKQITVDLSSG